MLGAAQGWMPVEYSLAKVAFLAFGAPKRFLVLLSERRAEFLYPIFVTRRYHLNINLGAVEITAMDEELGTDVGRA